MSAAQLRAIATHLDWMMQFLRAHHRAEDVGLYTLVRERDASLAELLDAMDTDHVRLAAAMAEVEGTG
jgi:Hemerythrin HHE cation binding domain